MADTACPKRRSIRDGFGGHPIPAQVVHAIVEAGLNAPSSKNAQPWRMHAVTKRSMLGRLATKVERARDVDRYLPIDPATGGPRRWRSTVLESANVLRSVSVGIFVENRGEFSNGRRSVAAAADDVRNSALVGYGLEMVGIGAAIQAMWHEAEKHNVVGVFMGDVAIAEDEISAILGVRGDLVGVLALGYSLASPTPKILAEDRAVWHQHSAAPSLRTDQNV